MVVRFKIVFPDFLDEKKKNIIRATLAGTERGKTDGMPAGAEAPAEEAKSAE